MLENPVRDTRRWSFSGNANTVDEPRRRDIVSSAMNCNNLTDSCYVHALVNGSVQDSRETHWDCILGRKSVFPMTGVVFGKRVL